MPLTWNVEDVDYYNINKDKLWKKYNNSHGEYEELNPETKSIVFATMSVGIGQITKSNADEFYGRWKTLERYYNNFLYTYFSEEEDKYVTVYLTPEIVEKHIGLVTNVGYINLTQWSKMQSENSSGINASDIKTCVKYYSLSYRERDKEWLQENQQK